MISRKQTTSKPLVHPHKQTNKQSKQRRQTNKPSARVTAEFNDQSQLDTSVWAHFGLSVHCCVCVCLSFTACMLTRTQVCEHIFEVKICVNMVASQSSHVRFWASMCVVCNPSRSGTTHQRVQRPVCIITACPAAQDRQTGLRALSSKTQTSHPIAETPVARPSPAFWPRNGQTNAYE